MPAAGKVLQLEDIINKDSLGCAIANNYWMWETYRQVQVSEWKELRKYVYATDTRHTQSSVLPWKNTTTIPKLAQIRDNLYANYMASMFPNPRWLVWEGSNADEQTAEKSKVIKAYMSNVIAQPEFKDTVSKLVLDYIDYGNCFVMPEWQDQRVDAKDGKIQLGYVGPVAKRISPLDIVMNPIAPSVKAAPKIVRSIVSLGEVKKMLDAMSSDEGERSANQELYIYLKEVRNRISSSPGDLITQDEYFQVDGFSNFREYLESNYCEILTFYGDIYDVEKDELLENHIIQVVDRHKVIRKSPHPSFFGLAPIYHAGWRPRQDNLWAMGPLANLVGMQYRIDHVENMKADLTDLVTVPPIKIKGYVDDFNWGPMEKIVVSEEGDVEIMKVDTNPLANNIEISQYEQRMEEMAGAPKEAMGFRTPGEKTKYEVQRLENAAGRIFQSKIAQFEEQILEPLLNAMLEMARRNASESTIRVLDDETQAVLFLSITPEDLTSTGRIRPMAARHFVEQAERVQNLTAWAQSPLYQDPMISQHFSSVKIAEMLNELLELEDYSIFQPYIRLTEQAEGEAQMAQLQENNAMMMQTASGIGEDYDIDAGPQEISPELANEIQP